MIFFLKLTKEKIKIVHVYSSVAQLVERSAVNRQVSGSIPDRGVSFLQSNQRPVGFIFFLFFLFYFYKKKKSLPCLGSNQRPVG